MSFRHTLVSSLTTFRIMIWYPHVTVAAIVPDGDKFLMVEETDETGNLVFNQPAGHLEPNESLIQAVIREGKEETGWDIEPIAILGFPLYTAHNGITYLRTNFIAKPVKYHPAHTLDDGIVRALWLTLEEIESLRDKLRSQLVLQAIRHYNSGVHYPLSILSAE